MPDKIDREDVAVIIRARRLLKDHALPPDADVKTICEHLGISRKTGYEWEKKFFPESNEEALQNELNQLKTAHAALKKSYDDLRFENEGRKIACKISGVDDSLIKKNTIVNVKSRK